MNSNKNLFIDRTIEELTHSDLEWQFWTKIIVEAIGCLGAGILTYVWGKSYVSLFVKWISFNRSFVILGKERRDSVVNGSGVGTYSSTVPIPLLQTAGVGTIGQQNPDGDQPQIGYYLDDLP